MSNEKYLRGQLVAQALNRNHLDNLVIVRNKVLRQIAEAMGESPSVYYGGSIAKDTMIKENCDIDIVLYWPADSPKELQMLYKKVGSILQGNWRYVHSKQVGWEVVFLGGFHVDVIPVKISSEDDRFENVYNRNTGGSIRTSIALQVHLVKESGLGDLLKLMKLWKTRKKVPIKTYILEFMVMEACKKESRLSLENLLNMSFNHLYRNILTRNIFDPANPKNIVSKILTSEDRSKIRKMAREALDAKMWHHVFL